MINTLRIEISVSLEKPTELESVQATKQNHFFQRKRLELRAGFLQIEVMNLSRWHLLTSKCPKKEPRLTNLFSRRYLNFARK